jgi:translation initiation factor IF-2
MLKGVRIQNFLIVFCALMQVIGLNNVPVAGDAFEVVESLDTAREKAESRVMSLRDERILAKAGDGKVTLSSLASPVSSGKLSGLDLHHCSYYFTWY